MKIYLVTQNEGKINEFQYILEPDIQVIPMRLDYREMRSDQPEDIVMEAAGQIAIQHQKPIVVEDSGLFIQELNEFPGTCSAYILKRIGLQGILKLMEKTTNRACYYKSAIGLGLPDGHVHVFSGQEAGSIALEIKGHFGFGFDPIFIPEGTNQTYAEMTDLQKRKKFRRQAIEDLLRFLKRQSF